MAASSLALECLVSPTLSVSHHPVTMPSAPLSFSSGLLRPVTRLAVSRSFTTRAHDPFYATMATSSLALKRLVSPTLLSGSRRPVILSAASRLFSTRAYDPFYDVYGATKTSHTELQGSSSEQPADHFELTRYVKHKNTADAIHLRLLMPGLAKEDAKVYIVKDELIAEGLKEKDFEDDKDDLMLRYRIHLPMHLVKADAITMEMKDGLLKVCVPMIDAQKMQPCF